MTLSRRDNRLVWVGRDGRRMVTPGHYPNMHRLLAEVERRAPHVRVES